MNLDRRIIEGKTYLDCFDTETAKQFKGKKCYFTRDLSRFENLDGPGVYKVTLTDISEGYEVCYGSLELGIQQWDYARFIIPCEWVKEPELTYRPYTVMEFIEYYPIGSHIHFRPKDKTIEMHRLIDGYNECKSGAGTLFMSGVMFSMMELYNNYEIFKDGEWQPFGIEMQGEE